MPKKNFAEEIFAGRPVKVTVQGTRHGVSVENGKLYLSGCDCAEEASLDEAKQMLDLLGAYVRYRRKLDRN